MGGACSNPVALVFLKKPQRPRLGRGHCHPKRTTTPVPSRQGWLPLHNAARWGAPKNVVAAALDAYPDAAKIGSRGGYEPLHLAAMGGHLATCEALVAVYPEGAFKKDNNGRTPLAESREGGHKEIEELILSLPGAREMDEAEKAMRAAELDALMRPDDMDVCFNQFFLPA